MSNKAGVVEIMEKMPQGKSTRSEGGMCQLTASRWNSPTRRQLLGIFMDTMRKEGKGKGHGSRGLGYREASLLGGGRWDQKVVWINGRNLEGMRPFT